MKKGKLNSILGELRQEFESLYGDRLKNMVLYGSQARGDAVDGSDIDVLVVLDELERSWIEVDRTSDVVCKISLKHDTVVAPIFINEHRYKHRFGPLLRNIRREGIPI